MRYENKTFVSERVTLDGNEFLNCTFQSCVWVSSGANFTLDRVRLEGTFSLVLADDATNTLNLLRTLIALPSTRNYVLEMLGVRTGATVQVT